MPRRFLEERAYYSPKWVRELENYVKEIMDEVRKNGDKALANFIKKYDGVKVDLDKFMVEREEIDKAYESIKEDEVSALKFSKRRIEDFQKTLLKRLKFKWYDEEKDVKVINLTLPIESVGCYVPGGYSPYPSSLLMAVVPAKIAKVPRIAICSPPMSDGKLNPILLVAADICGVDEIYKIGGAHAIAALAYGTESIKPVKKIVGPGNKYVTTAKMIASKDVAVDMPAGPSEILIIADDSANPYFIALDLISQAEHSPESICGLVTTSKELASKVISELEKAMANIARAEIIKKALTQNGFILICDGMNEAIDFMNDFAPEHLEIVAKRDNEIIEQIKSSGMVFLGPYSPVSAGDYCIGTNHILPTGGSSKFYSNLSVIDFIKRVSVVKCSKKGLQKMIKPISILARKEGLINHAIAVEERFKD
ncbi:MAG: histidinol dehydrogenase [archaeon]|nr:histidinol dehydrogenase [archaeon]MCP8319709.1 histidinol dehydrogenase [archaeon]